MCWFKSSFIQLHKYKAICEIQIKSMRESEFDIKQSLIKYELPVRIQSIEDVTRKEIADGKIKLRDILNVLIKPKISVQAKNTIYAYYADENKPSREDVDILRQKITYFLQIRKAKHNPICPIRQQIFSDAFDQILRQVLIDSPDRGIMLSRVRSEAYLTISAYRTLYEQSLSFSKAKLVETQNNLTQLQEQQQQLVQKQQKLKWRLNYLQSKKQSLEQKSREIKTIYKQKRQYEADCLQLQEDGLRAFLNAISFSKQQQEQMQRKQVDQNKRIQHVLIKIETIDN